MVKRGGPIEKTKDKSGKEHPSDTLETQPVGEYDDKCDGWCDK